MSGDCSCNAVNIPQESPSNLYSLFVYHIFLITSRTVSTTSTWALDFTSPAITTCHVVTSVSQATFEFGSCAKYSSTIASEI
jgi:hypothetical protein